MSRLTHSMRVTCAPVNGYWVSPLKLPDEVGHLCSLRARCRAYTLPGSLERWLITSDQRHMYSVASVHCSRVPTHCQRLPHLSTPASTRLSNPWRRSSKLHS